jgi:heme-degrading monooxygenase HmoA
MAIKVFIKRTCDNVGREKEFFGLIREIRSLVPQQPGYLSSEYLKPVDNPKEIVTISSWYSLEDWQNWLDSRERQEIQSRMDAIPGVRTEYEVFRYMKTR